MKSISGKRKRTVIELAVLAVVLLVGYWYLFLGRPINNVSDEITLGDTDTNAIVIYFTRSGVITAPAGVDAVTSASLNVGDGVTEQAALQLQKITGADLYQIRTKRYYRNSFGGTAATAWIEEKLNTRPALAAKPDNLDRYDVIYVGFPVWWFNAPMAIGSFLDSYDLTGKTVVPFCTSQDNGIDVCMDYIRKVSEGANVTEGFRFRNPSDEAVVDWLVRIGVARQENGQTE